MPYAGIALSHRRWDHHGLGRVGVRLPARTDHTPANTALLGRAIGGVGRLGGLGKCDLGLSGWSCKCGERCSAHRQMAY